MSVPKSSSRAREGAELAGLPFLPPVPSFLDDDVERPRTAPSTGWSIHERSRSFSGQLAAPRPGPPYRLPDRVYMPTHPPPVPPPGAPLARLSPASARQRAASISTVRSARNRTFVDVLDAQADFTLTNFQDRLRANGARDYGEDVADRNVGIKGSLLDLNDPLYEIRSRSGNHQSVGAARRSRSFVGMNKSETSLHSPSIGGPGSVRNRKSVGRFEDAKASASVKKDRHRSMPSYLNPPPLDETDRPEMPALKVIDIKQKPRRPTIGNDAPSGYREGTGRNAEMGASHRRSGSTKSAKQRTRSISSLHPPSRRSSYSMRASGLIVVDASVRPDSSASDSMDGFDFGDLTLASHRRGDSQDGAIDRGMQPRGLTINPTRSYRRFDFDDVIPERSSSLRPGSMDSTSGATSLSSNPFRPQSRHTANTSVDLTPGLLKNANFSHDSLREPSQPKHRASFYSMKSIKSTLSVRSLKRNPSSTKSAPRATQATQATAFNIDDYISSDDDLERPRHAQLKDEEQLLFNDAGYGMGGFELPGISSMGSSTNLPSATPPKIKTRSRSGSSFAEPRVESQLFHPPPFQMPSYDFGDMEDGEGAGTEEESDDEFLFDIPMTRRDAANRQNRISRYSSFDVEIVEEMEHEKLDIRTLMRIRKEANKAKRFSAISVASQRARSVKGKDKEVDFDGFEADVE